MMKIGLASLVLTLASFAALAQGESKCFLNESLQGGNSITFEINGNQIAGTFAVENSGDSELSKTYEFTGTLTGNNLKVKFHQNELPNVAPSVLKSLDWMLVKIGDEEVLRIKFHGKNYDTNKFADYLADFESCEPSYATLKKDGASGSIRKRKNFSNRAGFFQRHDRAKSFSIYIRKGQTLDIDAGSCRISVRLPNGEHYQFVEWESEDGTKKDYGRATIDGLQIKPIPQTGIYLVVLGKLSEDSPVESVTFKIRK